MPTLLIAYDLDVPSTVGAHLADAIMRLGTRWARPLASLWYIETNTACTTVEEQLSGLLGTDDGLLVQQVTGEAALANTMLRWTPRHQTAWNSQCANIIAWPNQVPAAPAPPEIAAAA